MHLYNRIIVHKGHIVCRQDFEEWYGEKLRNEYTDGKYDESFAEYVLSESKATRNIKAFCQELIAMSEQLEIREAYKVFGYAIRSADANLHIEQLELAESLPNYLKLLNEGK